MILENVAHMLICNKAVKVLQGGGEGNLGAVGPIFFGIEVIEGPPEFCIQRKNSLRINENCIFL